MTWHPWIPHVIIAVVCVIFLVVSFILFRIRRRKQRRAKQHRQDQKNRQHTHASKTGPTSPPPLTRNTSWDANYHPAGTPSARGGDHRAKHAKNKRNSVVTFVEDIGSGGDVPTAPATTITTKQALIDAKNGGTGASTSITTTTKTTKPTTATSGDSDPCYHRRSPSVYSEINRCQSGGGLSGAITARILQHSSSRVAPSALAAGVLACGEMAAGTPGLPDSGGSGTSRSNFPSMSLGMKNMHNRGGK